jgi:hypothetical protein
VLEIIRLKIVKVINLTLNVQIAPNCSQKVTILKRNDENVFDKREIQDFQTRREVFSQDKIENVIRDNVKREEIKKKEPDIPKGEKLRFLYSFF